MVRVTYSWEADAFADGAGGDKYLMDLSDELSRKYGRMIRQGQIFKIKSIEARLRSASQGVGLQDEVMAVSGKYIYAHPTKNRLDAWKNAFKTVQANRRLLGETQSGRATSSPGMNYDFRVGLAEGYKTDTGVPALPHGVKYNAWVQNEGMPLLLASSWTGLGESGIFNVWNELLITGGQPSDQGDGFGTWIDKNVLATTSELDFTVGDTPIFTPGDASTEFETAPFQVAFSSVFDSAGHLVSYDIGNTTNISITHDITAMCGLIGVYVDTSTVDDSEFQTQEYILEITVDVESWSPIFKKRKKHGRRKK